MPLLEDEVIELRWLLSLEQKAGSFSQELEVDRRRAFIRLQYRPAGLLSYKPWVDIPVESEIPEAPRIALVNPPGGMAS